MAQYNLYQAEVFKNCLEGKFCTLKDACCVDQESFND